MTAREVIERLARTRHPRDLEADIGKAVGWLRSEFRSVLPGLKYLAAIEQRNQERANRIMALIEKNLRSEQGLESAKRRLAAKRQSSALDLLSTLRLKMVEVYRAQKAWDNARNQLQKMVTDGVEMRGIRAKDHVEERVNRDLFWFRLGGQHTLDDYDNQVVTLRDGTVVYRDLQFWTEDVDAYLAAEGGATVGESDATEDALKSWYSGFAAANPNESEEAIWRAANAHFGRPLLRQTIRDLIRPIDGSPRRRGPKPKQK